MPDGDCPVDDRRAARSYPVVDGCPREFGSCHAGRRPRLASAAKLAAAVSHSIVRKQTGAYGVSCHDHQGGSMRLPARRWRLALAGVLAAALVFVAGVAVALGNQQQGNVTKLYVTSAPDFTTKSVQWTPVAGLLIIGTWHPGDLIVAHLDAETTCKSIPGPPPRDLTYLSLGRRTGAVVSSA